MTQESLALRWPTLDASDLASSPTLVADLLERRLDGATVSGIFSPEECGTIFDRLPLDQWQDHFIGKIVGMAVGMIDEDDPDRSAYLDATESARPQILQAFGFDPHERLRERLAPAAVGQDLVPVSENGRDYNPGQLRYWEPGRAGLRAHVGNEFREALADSAMSHMVTTTSVKDHLSYFVVVQQPDQGGTLSVYDLTWDDDDGSRDERVDLRDDSRFDNMPALHLNPAPGDLIIFGGGWRWHRVEPLTGTRARVTYGGFCAPSIDGTRLDFWA